jgi:5-methylcytosine-specific restriction endonuclease McrA
MSKRQEKYRKKNKKRLQAKVIEYKDKHFGTFQSKRFFQENVRPVVLKRDKHKCVKCGSKENLDVSHKRYSLLDLTIKDLETLCRSCHKRRHTAKLRGKI